MAKARELPGLHGDMTFGDAGRAAVGLRARELFEQSRDVLDTTDIERVHDMRVATRRLRAVLEVFAAAFDPGLHREALRDVKFAQRLRVDQAQGNQTLAAALEAMREHDLEGRLLALVGEAA